MVAQKTNAEKFYDRLVESANAVIDVYELNIKNFKRKVVDYNKRIGITELETYDQVRELLVQHEVFVLSDGTHGHENFWLGFILEGDEFD